ncbi:MAG: UdgX family uracil-DNA binding protein [Planctomycetota bacterium]
MQFAVAKRFDDWRHKARMLLRCEVPPEEVHWTVEGAQASLFAGESDWDRWPERSAVGQTLPGREPADPVEEQTVPKSFLALANRVGCHRAPDRWTLLYRVLWRLTHGERQLLTVSTDDDVLRLSRMEKSVRRDAHKMKAFVRFRRVVRDEQEHFIAWHRPDHHVLRLIAPFFSRRFNGMSWSIMTPDESVTWNQSKLQFGPGVPVTEAPDSDHLEDVWRTYYASIFNPARVKVKMMKQEMAVRYWKQLPEAEIIDDLIRDAPSRAREMIDHREGFAETATHYLPADHSFSSLAQAASNCQACDLCGSATQVVFGEGSENARVMLVGEQPGDEEDSEGRPFVGPAGRLLDKALVEAGLDRQDLYVTNTVKHFKFQLRGKRRIHQKPNSREVYACRPWLEAEMSLVDPQVIVCLGATAAQALLGRDFRITTQRGRFKVTDWCDQTMATWHPSAILRAGKEDKQQMLYRELVSDLHSVIARAT